MARRNLFDKIKSPAEPTAERAPSPERARASGYTARGASRNMLASIGELAERAAMAKDLLDGGAIVELDPGLLDSSFVSDRMDDDEGYSEFLEGIKERGQDTPILARPNPHAEGRYQIVFGHRRARAAKDLGRLVKAVVREVSDSDHVIAQGQENSARENLSFVERAFFAFRLQEQGYDRPIIQVALSVDNPMLTRMLSVSTRVPEEVAKAIGPARGIGRDRWLDFAQAVEQPDVRAHTLEAVRAPELSALPSDQRFERLMDEIKAISRRHRATPARPERSKWQPDDQALSAEFTDTGRAFALSFKSKGGREFGRFLAENLERFYGEFKQRNQPGKG